nr:hypothetical protein [uncultured Sphingobacterium sp.]
MKTRGFICLTEAPITLLTEMFALFNNYDNPMYAQYGIAIKKDYLFKQGARLVIYGTIDDRNQLGETLKWRFQEYIPNLKDYSWLREWRINEKEIQLDASNCFIITKTKQEIDKIIFNDNQIIDIEFDGCIADGQFWRSATGTFGRAFKGISFIDIKELNKLTKAELDKIIEAQSLDDTTERDLGGFTM